MKPFRRAVLRSLEQPGDVRTQQSFIKGGSGPRFNLLPFYIPLWQKRYPFRISSFDKWYPSHIPSLELCFPFNSVNCCKCTVFKIWINHWQNQNIFPTFFKCTLLGLLWQISLLFHILQWWNPYPFKYLKPEKRHPFWAEPTRMA